jgi:glutaredoxin domain-containing cysteine-rich protein 1
MLNYRTAAPPKEAALQYNTHTVALTSSTYGIMKLVESANEDHALASVIAGGAGGGRDAGAPAMYNTAAAVTVGERGVKRWESMPTPRMMNSFLSQNGLSSSWTDLGVEQLPHASKPLLRSSIVNEKKKDRNSSFEDRKRHKKMMKMSSKDLEEEEEIQIIDVWELMKGLEEDRTPATTTTTTTTTTPCSSSPFLLPGSHATYLTAAAAVGPEEAQQHNVETLLGSVAKRHQHVKSLGRTRSLSRLDDMIGFDVTIAETSLEEEPHYFYSTQELDVVNHVIAAHVRNNLSFSVVHDAAAQSTGRVRMEEEQDFTEECTPPSTGQNCQQGCTAALNTGQNHQQECTAAQSMVQNHHQLEAADGFLEGSSSNDIILFDPNILADFADSFERNSEASDCWCHVSSDGEEATSCLTSTSDDDDSPFHWTKMKKVHQCSSSERTIYEQQQQQQELPVTGTAELESKKCVSLSMTKGSKKMSSSKVSPIDDEEQKGSPLNHPHPLASYELKCPPGGEERVVLYSTSLRGIRQTFESCNNVRMILESFNVHVDERDVSMHAGFREELKALIGKPIVSVPRVFINGYYIGGAEEVIELHEDGLLLHLVKTLPVQTSRQICDCCGGIRFVPCTECSGSCKILTHSTNKVTRCPYCNENGLIRCTLCF